MAARLEAWLQATEAVDLVQSNDGWEVWVSNGRGELLFEGVPIATCQGELEAELVMEGLRLLKARPTTGPAS